MPDLMIMQARIKRSGRRRTMLKADDHRKTQKTTERKQLKENS